MEDGTWGEGIGQEYGRSLLSREYGYGKSSKDGSETAKQGFFQRLVRMESSPISMLFTTVYYCLKSMFTAFTTVQNYVQLCTFIYRHRQPDRQRTRQTQLDHWSTV